MSKQLPYSQKGQVVLIILLILTVLLTVGLSVASRSVTDIKISQQSQESARALWVAQAGLEQAMKANVGTGGDIVLNNVTYKVTAATGLDGGNEFVFPDKVSADDSRTFWLVEHDASGQINELIKKYNGPKLTIYWGDSTNSPALEVTYIYKDNSDNFHNVHYAFDPQTRTPPTNFSPVGSGGTILGVNFPRSGSISTSGKTPYLLKIKPMFNSSPVQIGLKVDDSSHIFPSQGNCFDSTATVLESNITRKLTECRYWQTTPSIFDYLLFSGGGL